MKSVKMLGLAVLLLACSAAGFAAEVQLDAGFRATAVSATKLDLLRIKAGDHIDMFVTNTKNGQSTVCMLQDVLVLDTVDKSGTQALILALRPKEALYATLVQFNFHINYVVRANGDDVVNPGLEANASQIFSAAPENNAQPKDKMP